MEKKKNKTETKEEPKIKADSVQTAISTRGRSFEGKVTKKFADRIVVEFERVIYAPKYERFYKKKTRLHARLPAGMLINVGDYAKLKECRPISKIIHFIVIGKKDNPDNPKQEAKK